ncbi:MAG: glycosyl hydrolase [Anaerolineaceae bacterium]|nr:glycosyl hydrolase [Anaerolineaceae bacterium]
MKDVKNLVAKMTLEEKASMCSGLNFWYLKGIDRLGIPSIMVTDGPHGLRKQARDADHIGLNESIPATCFPTASALAATWNRDLIYQVGVALGEETKQEKVGVILGPAVNIKRSPLCGRNFEYFSEDPYLTGELAKSYIQGVQSLGVGTSLKHYAVNNQEYKRMTIDAIVDERALREIYLPGYEIAVKEAQPWTVMGAYNKLNGTYCCENKTLMTNILKEEWGHEGLVVTDWGAMNDQVEALKAGVELQMPGTHKSNDANIVAAVKTGVLEEATLGRAVERILTLIFKAEKSLSTDYTYDKEAHHLLARQAAAEGAVLLKNEEQILPLKPGLKIGLIGRFAKYPRYQGAGSSLINPRQLDNLYDELINLIGEENVNYADGYTERGHTVEETLLQEALNVASQTDVVVICAGLTELYETEGVDRNHMKMPVGHNALIDTISTAHNKVIVVLSNGSPVEMPWVEKVSAILEAYLGGQAGAGAIADILVGKTNPSGKLAETFPNQLEDNPSFSNFPGGPAIVEYRESIYIGYRYYDKVDQAVLYPFGYGLSYTQFEYHDLNLIKSQNTTEDWLTVTFKIKNTGLVAGKEIAQVYVRDIESSVFRPPKELKGFSKVNLQPGEEKEITIHLDQRAFAFYDVTQKDWIVESGEFEILVGASSQDIRLKGTTLIKSSQKVISPKDQEKLDVYYNLTKENQISKADFEALLGHALPPNQNLKKGQYTINTPICEMSDSFIGRQLHRLMKKQIVKVTQEQEGTPLAILMEAMVNDLPLRGILMMGGPLSRNKLEALLLMINGHFLKGLMAWFKR